MNQKKALKKVMDLAEPQHTPTPWEVKHYPGNQGLSIISGNKHLANLIFQLDDREKANAAFIVRAVNSHTDLLVMLQAAAEVLKLNRFPGLADECLKAIARAEGK